MKFYNKSIFLLLLASCSDSNAARRGKKHLRARTNLSLTPEETVVLSEPHHRDLSGASSLKSTKTSTSSKSKSGQLQPASSMDGSDKNNASVKEDAVTIKSIKDKSGSIKGINCGKAKSAGSDGKVKSNKSSKCTGKLKAGDDVFETAVNAPINISDDELLKNDNNGLAIESCADPAVGSLERSQSSFIYTPETDFTGLTTFPCIVSDGELTDTALVTVHIAGAGSPNLSVADNVNVIEDTPTVIEPLVNDTDGVVFYSYSKPIHGSIVSNGDGTLTYVPDEHYFGPDEFEYTVTDGINSDVASVYINVSPVSEDPVTTPDKATTTQGFPVVIDVLENDFDPDGSDIKITSYTQPNNGALVFNPDGSFTYTPDVGYVGQDTFTYMVLAGDRESSETPVTINVVEDGNIAEEPEDDMILVLSEVVYANLPPNVADITLATTAQVPLPITVQDIIANTNDPDGDELTVTQCDQPENGVLGQDLTYTPNTGFVGEDSCRCVVCDDDNACGTVNVFILVNAAAPMAPVALSDSYTTFEGAPVVMNVLLNDSPNGVVNDFTMPVHGTVVKNNDGTLTYIPDDSFSGVDTFEYVLVNSGGVGGSSIGSVSINVKAVAAPPSAQNDYYSTFVNTPLTIDASVGVLSNDGDQLAVTSVIRQPSNGVLSQREDGSFTYIPQQWWIGTDTYEYEAVDANGQTATATVSITVQQPTAMIIPSSGSLVGGQRNGTSSDCKLGFTDCQGVNTVSASLRGKAP